MENHFIPRRHGNTLGKALGRKGQVWVARKIAGDLLVGVDQHMSLTGCHYRKRQLVTGHQAVAAEHQICRTRIKTHGTDGVRSLGDSDMAGHGTALLSHTKLVDCGKRLALDMRTHSEDGTDGDYARATNTGDEQVEGPVSGERCQCRLRQIDQMRRWLDTRRGAARPPTNDTDETRAEALGTGIVLVAGRLVDAPLAPKRRVRGQHGHAVGLDVAVAATLADARVDEDPSRRVADAPALAPTPLLGGTGLVVNQHADATDLA